MSTVADVKYGGITVKVGNRTMVFPPLNFRQLKDPNIKALIEKFGVIGGKASDEQLDAATDVIHACLVRNYPDLSKDFLLDNLDLMNLRGALGAIFGVEIPVGELLAAQPKIPIGINSTAGSST